MHGLISINRNNIHLFAGIASGSLIGLGAFSLASTATIALASAAILSLGVAILCAVAVGLLSGITIALITRRVLEPTSLTHSPLSTPSESTDVSEPASLKASAPTILSSEASLIDTMSPPHTLLRPRLSPTDFNTNYPKANTFSEKDLSSQKTLYSLQAGVTLSWIKMRLKFDRTQGLITSPSRPILRLGEHVQLGGFGRERTACEMLDILQLVSTRQRPISSMTDVADWSSHDTAGGAVLWLQGQDEGTSLGIVCKGARVELLDATQGTWSMDSSNFTAFLADYLSAFYPQYQATMLTPIQLR